MRIIVTVVIMLCAALLIQELVRVAYLYTKAKKTEQVVQKYEKTDEGAYTLLIVGDRSVFSLGLEDVKDSLPGQIAEKLIPGKIIVDGRPDLTTKEVVEIISSHIIDTPDIVVISVGENDMLQFAKTSDVESSLTKAVQIANELSDYNVVVLGPRNFGEAPIMPPIFSSKYSSLSEDYNDHFDLIATENGADFIRGPQVGGSSFPIRVYFTDGEFHYSKEAIEIWANNVLEGSKKLRVFLQ